MLLGQVVEKLIRGLAMEESKNLFSLFEHNSVTDRALESRVIVADVLAKFERYRLGLGSEIIFCGFFFTTGMRLMQTDVSIK